MRNYKSKNIQTKPSLSGVKNMPKDYVEKNKAVGNGEVLKNLMPIWETGTARRKKGVNWTEDLLMDAIREFFIYCAEHEVKPYKNGLALWLGCSRTQYWEWETMPNKYGVISNVINEANAYIEGQYIGRAEQYPTANLFLLRTSHGHVEVSKVDVTTSNSATTPEEMNDVISKLGLDKPKE